MVIEGQEWSDFRSDTVTQPTARMRLAMAEAEVGDDVYGEDPTVQRLEQLAAQMLGKEEALFVTSGTQGNLIAVLSHTQKGNEILLEADSHIYYYEVGGISAVGGVMPRLIKGQNGVITPNALTAALRGENIHFPAPTLLCIENSHNRAGGTVWSAQETAETANAAHEAGLRVHMDGARIFNAAIAQRVDVRELTAPVDSVMFCLSKGLGAPVGSLLLGSREFIAQARKWRKMLGGGMRQAGVLAAAGIVALEEMVDRLAEDHALAHSIASGLQGISNLTVDQNKVQTNIVLIEVSAGWGSARQLVGELRQEGILATEFGAQTMRLVTHKDVGEKDAARVLAAFRKIFPR